MLVSQLNSHFLNKYKFLMKRCSSNSLIYQTYYFPKTCNMKKYKQVCTFELIGAKGN